MDGHGQRLGIVADRAAADGENQIRVMIPCDPDTLAQFGKRRIRHDARDLRDVFVLLVQNLADGVVEAVSLDRTAAVHQYDIVPVFRKLGVQVFQ